MNTEEWLNAGKGCMAGRCKVSVKDGEWNGEGIGVCLERRGRVATGGQKMGTVGRDRCWGGIDVRREHIVQYVARGREWKDQAAVHPVGWLEECMAGRRQVL